MNSVTEKKKRLTRKEKIRLFLTRTGKKAIRGSVASFGIGFIFKPGVERFASRTGMDKFTILRSPMHGKSD